MEEILKMTNNKKIEGWAIWNEKLNEPWGVLPHDSHQISGLLSFAIYAKKSYAIRYRLRAWLNAEERKKIKIKKVRINYDQ